MLTKSVVSILVCLFSYLVFGYSESALAHPGNTSSDGAHYCWTNCDYWGEVYGQRHYHGGGSYIPAGPSMFEQGEENGREHAESINSSYITQSAENEADEEGYEDGLSGSSSSEDPSFDVCDEDIEFSNAPDPDYAEAFQVSYSEACREVYEVAYSDKYPEAFDRGVAENDSATGDNAEGEDGVNDSDSSGWIGILLFYSIFLLIGGVSWFWDEYGESIKTWLNE